MKVIPFKLGLMGLTCLFYMISAVVLLSAYFATEKLTTTALFMVAEARLFVVICSAIHFALAAISFFTTCSLARLQTEYIYVDDKWFNELWSMLDMDHDQRYLTKRLEQAESGDHDDDDADDEDEDEYLEPISSLSDLKIDEADKFYPLKMVETEKIIVEVPESMMNEIKDHLEKDEIHKAEDGKESVFTLANVLMTLQSSKLGKLQFPTDTKRKPENPEIPENSKLQEMKSTMERTATEIVEGIKVKTIEGQEQPQPEAEEEEPLLAVEVHQPEHDDKNGQERIQMVFTIEKALPDNLDLETIAKSGLEQISEKLGIGRMY